MSKWLQSAFGASRSYGDEIAEEVRSRLAADPTLLAAFGASGIRRTHFGASTGAAPLPRLDVLVLQQSPEVKLGNTQVAESRIGISVYWEEFRTDALADGDASIDSVRAAVWLVLGKKENRKLLQPGPPPTAMVRESAPGETSLEVNDTGERAVYSLTFEWIYKHGYDNETGRP